MLDKVHRLKQIRLARARRTATLIDASHRVWRTEDHGTASDRVKILGMSNSNTGNIGQCTVHFFLFLSSWRFRTVDRQNNGKCRPNIYLAV